MTASIIATSVGALPVADTLYEVVNGQVREPSPMGAFESDCASELVSILREYAKRCGLGRAIAETLFLLRQDVNLQRRPDVAFVSYLRWPKNKRVPRVNAWPVVPNLAIEIVSLTNTAEEVLEKVRDYFHAGVELVWVIYPNEEQVYVYHSPTQNTILARADELDGETVLPGFRLPLETLFPEEAEETPETP